MGKFNEVITILELSVKRHGNQPLTVEHLLNIMKMVTRMEEEEMGDASFFDINE